MSKTTTSGIAGTPQTVANGDGSYTVISRTANAVAVTERFATQGAADTRRAAIVAASTHDC